MDIMYMYLLIFISAKRRPFVKDELIKKKKKFLVLVSPLKVCTQKSFPNKQNDKLI